MKLAHHYSGNLSLAVVLSALAMTLDAYAADKLDRTVLPIPEPSGYRSPRSTPATRRRRRGSRSRPRPTRRTC